MNRILKRYKNLSKPLKASVWFMICSVLQKGISLIITPIFTRILSTSEYGIVSVYNSWYDIVTIFATLYLSYGIFNNGMLEFEADQDGYTSSMLSLTSFLTVGLLALYLPFTSFFNHLFGLSTPIMIMMLTDIFFTAAISFWSVRNRYEYRYISVVIITLIASLLVPVTSVLLVLNTKYYKAEARIFGMVLVHVIVYGIVYIMTMKKGKVLYQKAYWIFAVKFNIPLIPHYLSTSVLNQSDRILINSICGSTDAAIYSVSYQLASTMNIVTNSINASFIPWTYRQMKEKRYSQIGKAAVKIELLVGMCCLSFSLFGPEFIKILATEEYYNAIWVIPPVAMSVLFSILYNVFANIEFYFKKTVFVAIASVMAAICNIALNVVLIPLYGFAAAGYTTLFCYIIYSIAHYIFMLYVCKENKIDNPYHGVLMWLIAAAFAALSIGISVLYTHTMLRYGVIGLLMGITFIIGFIKKMK